jgi:hypothetical protein
METSPLSSQCMHEEFHMPFLEFLGDIHTFTKGRYYWLVKMRRINGAAVL